MSAVIYGGIERTEARHMKLVCLRKNLVKESPVKSGKNNKEVNSMKKRIFMLALVVGVLLSVCASAWATTYLTITNLRAEYETIYKAEQRQGAKFSIRVRAEINPTPQTQVFDANRIVWTVSQDAGNQIISPEISPTSKDIPSSGDVAEVRLTGIISGEGTVRVTGTLYKDNVEASGTAAANQSVYKTKFTEVQFVNTTGTETPVQNFPSISGDTPIAIEDVLDGTASQKADPDSEFWDGIDPKYPSATLEAQAALTADKGAKPKLGKIEKTALTFAAGTAGTLTIPITGGCPVVDVYIAAKDAIKLGWLPRGSTTDIQLTKANIKSYDIPFRINAESITTDTTKTASSTLTLAFNGANVAYKGFPITIAMTNSLTGTSKPVKKAVKINVTPIDKLPTWYRDEYTELTGTKDVDLSSGDIIGVVDGSSIVSKDYTYVSISGDMRISGDYRVASGDSTVTYSYTYYGYKPVAYDKSARPKQVWEIAVPLTGSGDVDESDSPLEFYVSGDNIVAPYIITVKGEKNGVSVDITQPEYDNLGNVTEPGSVLVGGKLTQLLKETKTGLTLTATNPSTKKKGAVKVTVIGKVPAYFDKFEKSGDEKWVTLTPKYVEAGKVPSMKAKAKGSKTISYEGYSVDDEDRYPKDFGLSFDMKKATFVAVDNDKTKVIPTVDDDGNFAPLKVAIRAYNGIGEGEEIYGYLGVTGAKPSLNTKTVDFTASDYENGKFQTFALNAGRVKPALATTTGANVKAYPGDGAASVLSGLGLEMVTWESMDKEVSIDKTVTSGDTLFASGSTESGDYKLVSSDGTTTLNKTVYTKKDASGNLVLSCDEGVEVTLLYGSKTVTGNESYKNKGIIRVADVTKMKAASKQKINVILDNIGKEGKGAVTINIAAKATTSSSNGVSINSTVNVNAKAGKTNGTASLTYNGALPDADADTESAEEATVTIGEPRTAADLSAAQQAFLAAKGLKVIAVLPEISANVDGQQEFAVELDEDAPEGAKMVYVPFPQDVEETEDDKIADFYGADGEAIEEVPAEKDITVAPWLRAGVEYQPVIAVKEAK